ncbi:MAG: hypothetical protein L0219_11245, partial [Phycisphaerales bacterium]|nr:hypothetical protein [Phycisphaerales bacterium]
ILIAHLWGVVEVSCIKEMYAQSRPLMDEIDGPVWRITNTYDVETTFSDLMQILGKATSNEPGSTTDPRITSLLVGSDAWVKMVSASLQQRQYGALNVPLLHSVDEALARAREQIASNESA